jgi:hypothetical protein
MVKDTITNWNEKVKKNMRNDLPLDKNYKNHLVKPATHIGLFGSTGSGKTTSLVEFLHRTKGVWTQIIIFTGAGSTDEQLYQFLQEAIPEIVITNDIEELPKLEDFCETHNQDQKLVCFDDSSLLENKQMKQIMRFFMAARKMGISVWFLSQNYHSTPSFIRRNISYMFLYKIPDLADLKKIHSKNCADIPFNLFNEMYRRASADKGNFLKIDLTENNPLLKYKHNFIGTL